MHPPAAAPSSRRTSVSGKQPEPSPLASSDAVTFLQSELAAMRLKLQQGEEKALAANSQIATLQVGHTLTGTAPSGVQGL